MRILIVGAGGIGGYFGGLLARAGLDVTFLARGDHLRALQRDGLRVDSTRGSFEVSVRASDSVEGLPPQDLALFCVKTYDTEPAARLVAPALAADGLVLSLQNGVDGEETVGAIVGPERFLAGTVRIESTLVEPGVVQQRGQMCELIFGEPDGRDSPRARRMLEVLRSAGIPAELTTSIQVELWRKFITLSSVSGLTTVCRATIGEVMTCEPTRAMAIAAVKEAYAVGRASGVPLPDDLVDRGIAYLDGMPYYMKSSMCRDAERGRRLEMEALSGATVRRGRALGVPVPTHEFIYAALLPTHLRAVAACERSIAAEA